MNCFIRKLKSRGFVISISAIIVLAVISISPYLIGKNFTAEKLTANDWMSFYGGYFGAILGLVGVIISIFYSSREAKIDRLNTLNLANEERRHSKIPFIKIEDIGNIEISKAIKYPQLILGQNKQPSHATTFRLLRFTNIGTGPAINFIINLEKASVVRDNIVELDIKGKLHTSLLDQNDFFDICIIINEKEHLLQSILSSETPYVFKLLSEFKDMFDNKYIQEFRFAYKLSLKSSSPTKTYKTIFLNDHISIGKPEYVNKKNTSSHN